MTKTTEKYTPVLTEEEANAVTNPAFISVQRANRLARAVAAFLAAGSSENIDRLARDIAAPATHLMDDESETRWIETIKDRLTREFNSVKKGL